MKERTHKDTFLALGILLVTLTALLIMPAATTMGAKPVDNDGDGWSIAKGDCNDSDNSVYPGAQELCDNKDNNCDGQIDEGDVCGVESDVDGDGYTVGEGGDCKDLDPEINPGATEICGNGIDENCNDLIDEGCGGVGDADGDGFLDTTEEAGIILPTDFKIAGTVSGTSLPVCSDPADIVTPCVHPDRPDLFVVINRASSSNIPSPSYDASNPDPLAILRGFTDANGNPVVPHELELVDPSTPPPSREIADGQNAVIVNELLDADYGPLGFAPTGGTPNTTSGTVNVYTVRISDEVNRLCDSAYICDRKGVCNLITPINFCQNEDNSIVVDMSVEEPFLLPLYYRYMQNVIAHEIWHVGSLAPSDSEEVTFFHFNANTGWVMEQSIGSKGVLDRDGTVTVTLYISDIFNDASRANYKLN